MEFAFYYFRPPDVNTRICDCVARVVCVQQRVDKQ